MPGHRYVDSWRSFTLMEIPQPEYQRSHNETCGPCREAWTLSAFAVHEATHAAVAEHLGIKVLFTAIDESKEIELTAAEAALYPMLRAGMKVPAIATRLDQQDLRRKPKEVFVAMVAPSCVHTGHRQVDDYSGLESFIAVRLMKARNVDPDDVLDLALFTVEKPEVQDRVLQLAGQLAESGWVDLT